MVRNAFLRMKKIYSWQRGVQNLFRLRSPILRIGRLIRAKYTKGLVRSIVILLFRLESIRKKNGLKGVCLYMKGCSILIIKFISKDPTDRNSVTYGPHISLTRRKIPRILPLYFRNEISKGNQVIIRLVLTMLGLYRVLPFPAPLKTHTITNSTEFQEVPYDFRLWFISFSRYFLKDKLIFRDSINPFMISSAGNSLEKPLITILDKYGYDILESPLWDNLHGLMTFRVKDKLKSSMY